MNRLYYCLWKGYLCGKNKKKKNFEIIFVLKRNDISNLYFVVYVSIQILPKKNNRRKKNSYRDICEHNNLKTTKTLISVLPGITWIGITISKTHWIYSNKNFIAFFLFQSKCFLWVRQNSNVLWRKKNLHKHDFLCLRCWICCSFFSRSASLWFIIKIIFQFDINHKSQGKKTF